MTSCRGGSRIFGRGGTLEVTEASYFPERTCARRSSFLRPLSACTCVLRKNSPPPGSAPDLMCTLHSTTCTCPLTCLYKSAACALLHRHMYMLCWSDWYIYLPSSPARMLDVINCKVLQRAQCEQFYCCF